MSDEGFHEVQLSGKQLVFLFMSGVVLLVVVFLLGVAVGRSVRDAALEAPVSADAGLPETVVPDPAAAPAGTDPAKPKDPELSYHEMLVGTAATPPAAAPVTPPAPIAETVPPPVAPPAAAPPAAAPPEPRTAGWFLQIGAYSTRAVADAQLAKLKQLDVPVFVLVPAAGSPDKLFKVRVGPYADRADAEQASARLQRQGYRPEIRR
jgi:cell division septation protein DedD